MFIHWFLYIYNLIYIIFCVYVFFSLHRLAILQLVDLPSFPWLSIPGSTMEVRIIIPFARRQRNANNNYWATGVACCQWGKNLVTIWCVKKWYWLHRYLLEFCYLSWWISGIMDFVGICLVKFEVHWRPRTFFWERCYLSHAFHCPWVRFLGLSSQNLLIWYTIQIL